MGARPLGKSCPVQSHDVLYSLSGDILTAKVRGTRRSGFRIGEYGSRPPGRAPKRMGNSSLGGLPSVQVSVQRTDANLEHPAGSKLRISHLRLNVYADAPETACEIQVPAPSRKSRKEQATPKT